MLRQLRPHFFLCFTALLALPPQTPAQPPPTNSSQSTSQTPAPSGITLKTATRLVVVDVVVTDSKDQPVHNLKQSDFSVFESNNPQTIRSFEEHIYPNPKAAAPASMPVLPPGIFTNFFPAPPGDSLNIILLDSLNTPMQDQAYVREQLKKYLKTSRPGVRTAIFGLITHLILLQSFTSDPEILKAVIDKKNPANSPLLEDPTVESVSDQLSDTMGNDPTAAQVIANLQQFEAQQQSFQLQLRAQYTLDAMNLLARYLSGLPGRKNLIWFSGSFPIDILPDGDLPNPFAVVASSEEEFRQTTNMLSFAQVSVYPVDARGLMTSPTLNAAVSNSKYARNPTAYNKDETKFFQQTASEHSTMLEMASQTGGHAFLNNNGLAEAVASAVQTGSNYYTITYNPTDPRWNGNFRKIQVKLQQQGLNLSYRRGYFANDPDAPVKADKPKTLVETATKGAQAPPPPDPMRTAMMRGAPDPTEVIFKARILPAAIATEDALAPGSSPNPNSKLSHGPYRRYVIDIAADPRSVAFTRPPETVSPTADNLYHGALQVRVYVYDQDGNLIIDSISNSHADLDAAGIRHLSEGGIQLHHEISVPAKGNYFLRVGIHDLVGDRLGAIEVPIASVKNLPPPGAPAPSKSAPAPVAPK